MTAKEFFDLVVEMRKRQKLFFSTHAPGSLQAAKDVEKLIDAEIARVQRLTTEPELEFE